MIYELRIYEVVPGKLPDLNRRFETITLKIWERLGIKQAGFWTADVGHQQRADLPAGLGEPGRARGEVDEVPGRPGVEREARPDRGERSDRGAGPEQLPAPDAVLVRAVAPAFAHRQPLSQGRGRGSPLPLG